MDELQDSQNSMDPHNFFAQGKFKENLRSWIQKNPWEEPGVGLDPQGGLGLILLQEILWVVWIPGRSSQRKSGEFGELLGKGKIPKFWMMDSVGSRNGLE